MFNKSIRLVRQTESSECLLACLAMVLEANGAINALRTLRNRYSGLTRGGSLRDLIELGQAVGMGVRAVKCDLADLGFLRLPAVLHWGFGHFVVLSEIKRGQYRILDPARGELSLSADQVSRHYTGVAAEIIVLPGFDPEALSSKADAAEGMSLRSLIRGFGGSVAEIAGVSTIVLLFSMVSPLAVQIVVDEVVVKNDYDLLLLIAVAFVFANITAAVADYFHNAFVLSQSARLRVALTHGYLQRLMRLPWEHFGRRGLGNFVAQYASLGFLVRFVVADVAGFITSSLFVVAITAILLFINSGVALLVLFVNVALFALRIGLIGHARRLQDRDVTEAASEESFFVETMRGIASVKSNRLEIHRTSAGVDRTLSATNASYRLGLFDARYDFAVKVIKSIEMVTVVYLLTLQVLGGAMSIGVMYAFYSYRLFLDQRFGNLVGAVGDMLNLKVHRDRLADSYEALPPPVPASIADFLRLDGRLTLENLTYRLDNGRTTLFENLNLSAEKGEFVHVSGPTGTGKSTLLRILLGGLDPLEGRVLYDGIPLSAHTLTTVRNSVGVVLQEDVLFNGTILQNVAQFGDAIDMQRVVECCRLSMVHDEIVAMPQGYHSAVGDIGSNLSTGQQQRLLLARALYRNPSILVLDEATANLNAEVEAAVLQNLRGLGKTVIFASHSSAVASAADQTWHIRPVSLQSQETAIAQ